MKTSTESAVKANGNTEMCSKKTHWPPLSCPLTNVILCVLKVVKLKEQLESTVQKLNESKDVLKTNENGEDLLTLAFFSMSPFMPSLLKVSLTFWLDFNGGVYSHSDHLAEQAAEWTAASEEAFGVFGEPCTHLSNTRTQGGMLLLTSISWLWWIFIIFLPQLLNVAMILQAHFRPQAGGLSLPVGSLADFCPIEPQAGQTAKRNV